MNEMIIHASPTNLYKSLYRRRTCLAWREVLSWNLNLVKNITVEPALVVISKVLQCIFASLSMSFVISKQTFKRPFLSRDACNACSGQCFAKYYSYSSQNQKQNTNHQNKRNCLMEAYSVLLFVKQEKSKNARQYNTYYSYLFCSNRRPMSNFSLQNFKVRERKDLLELIFLG